MSSENLTCLDGSIEDWLESQMARDADYFKARPLLLDIGAYHGEFSARFLQAGLFREAVLCEPNPDNREAIAAKHGADPRFHLHPNACSDMVGGATLVCRGERSTGSILPYEGDRPGPKKEHAVEVTTVDALLAAHAYPAVGLIKCDTQGNDLRVLRGAVKTLQSHRPWLVVEMLATPRFVHQAWPVEVMQFLSSQNYFLAAQFSEFYTATGWLAWYDACFVPQELFSMEATANFSRPTAAEAHGRKRGLGRSLGKFFQLH